MPQFLYSPLLPEVLPWQAALSVLAHGLRDSSPDVRVSSLQGLSNILFHPEKVRALRGWGPSSCQPLTPPPSHHLLLVFIHSSSDPDIYSVMATSVASRPCPLLPLFSQTPNRIGTPVPGSPLGSPEESGRASTLEGMCGHWATQLLKGSQ